MSDKALDAVRHELRDLLKNGALVSNNDLIGVLLKSKPKVVKEAAKALQRMALIKLIHDVAGTRQKQTPGQFELFEGITYPDFVWVKTFNEHGTLTGRMRKDPMKLTREEGDQLFFEEGDVTKKDKRRNDGLRTMYLACRPHLGPGMVLIDAVPLADAAAKSA